MSNKTDELKPLLWLDLETPGVDSTFDPIIEVGAIITTPNFLAVGQPFHALIRLPYDFNKSVIPPVVRQMHDASGLWRDLNTQPVYPDVYMADLSMADWIIETLDLDDDFMYTEGYNAKQAPVMLAGSGVSHFDSWLVKRHLPKTWTCIAGFDHNTKPTLDIGVIRRFLKYAGLTDVLWEQGTGEADGLTPHRALDDVKMFIHQARRVARAMNDLTTDAQAWAQHQEDTKD